MSEDERPRTIDEYKELLKIKNQIIDGLDYKYEAEMKLNEIAKERIRELNEKLNQKQKLETISDINYWRGIEKAYEEKLNEYLDRIIFLEKRDALFEMENESLREEMRSSGKVSRAAKYDFKSI